MNKKVIGLALAAVFTSMLSIPSSSAAPNNGGGTGANCPQNKTFESMSRKECKACKGSWDKGTGGACGLAGLGAASSCMGAVYVPNIFSGAACLLSAGTAWLVCEPGCKSTPASSQTRASS